MTGPVPRTRHFNLGETRHFHLGPTGVLLIISVPVTGADPCRRGCRVGSPIPPNGELSDASFTWDWAGRQNAAQDYLDAFNALNRANGNRLWLSEVAGRVDVSRWYIPRTSPAPAGDASAATTATDPMEDLRVITSTLSMNPYVSRLRADLPAIMLDRDLDLGASDRPDRPALYQYARQANVPPRPVCLGPGDAGFISNDVTVVVSMADAGPASLDGGVASDDAV